MDQESDLEFASRFGAVSTDYDADERQVVLRGGRVVRWPVGLLESDQCLFRIQRGDHEESYASLMRAVCMALSRHAWVGELSVSVVYVTADFVCGLLRDSSRAFHSADAVFVAIVTDVLDGAAPASVALDWAEDHGGLVPHSMTEAMGALAEFARLL